VKELKVEDISNIVSSWVHIYGDELFTWAYHKVSDRAIAEDLVQDTFLSAYRAFTSFEGRSEPKTWLFKILNNKVIDHYRKSAKSFLHLDIYLERGSYHITESLFDENENWKSNGLEPAWDDEQNLMDVPEFNQVMEICLNDLPLNWKLVVSAKYLLEKDPKEICQELQISASNYWQILHRAKLLLKKCIENKWLK
jgi:RNA polymerase sigma-70 factor (TIGR02943 family)